MYTIPYIPYGILTKLLVGIGNMSVNLACYSVGVDCPFPENCRHGNKNKLLALRIYASFSDCLLHKGLELASAGHYSTSLDSAAHPNAVSITGILFRKNHLSG